MMFLTAAFGYYHIAVVYRPAFDKEKNFYFVSIVMLIKSSNCLVVEIKDETRSTLKSANTRHII